MKLLPLITLIFCVSATIANASFYVETDQKNPPLQESLQLQPQSQAKNPAQLIAIKEPLPAIIPIPKADLGIKPIVPTKWETSLTDKQVSTTIKRWCAESQGTCSTVRWTAHYDVSVSAIATFTGTLDNAVDQMISSISKSTKHAFNYQFNDNGVLLITD